MKSKGYQKHMEKKKMLAGKKIVGIDPAKEKHQAAVLNEEGIQMGRSFSFPVSHEGYSEKLWKEIGKILGDYGTEDLAFAVETSCALWKTLTAILFSILGTPYLIPLSFFLVRASGDTIKYGVPSVSSTLNCRIETR